MQNVKMYNIDIYSNETDSILTTKHTNNTRIVILLYHAVNRKVYSDAKEVLLLLYEIQWKFWKTSNDAN